MKMQTAGYKNMPSFGSESSSASDWTVSSLQDENKVVKGWKNLSSGRDLIGSK